MIQLILKPTWLHFGENIPPKNFKDAAKASQLGATDDPRAAQDGSRAAQEAPQTPQEPPKSCPRSILEAAQSLFGAR